MNTQQIELTGTLRPDGVLELDGPVALGPGRVVVTVRPVQEQRPSEVPEDDPFWQMMKAIWAIPGPLTMGARTPWMKSNGRAKSGTSTSRRSNDSRRRAAPGRRL
jgi:hypothetical protein